MQPAPDGGLWVSWLDRSLTDRWDVRVQRLDSFGFEVFSPAGVLVADQDFFTPYPHELAVSADGSALLAYRDDSLASQELGLSRVTPDGTVDWSTTILTSGGVSDLELAPMADGGAVVAWTPPFACVLLMQRVDSAGNPLWASPVELAPTTGSYQIASLQESGDGVIVLIEHNQNGCFGPTHLKAQRLDVAGAPTWGPTAIDVFAPTSAFAESAFPQRLVSDGQGGVLVVWNATLPNRTLAQRIDMSGLTQWAPGGVPVVSTGNNGRSLPQVAFDPTDQSTYVAWIDSYSPPRTQDVNVQRLDSTGAQLWGDGVAVTTKLPEELSNLSLLLRTDADGVKVAWEASSGMSQDAVHAANLDPTGVAAAPFSVAAASSDKQGVIGTVTKTKLTVYAWVDSSNRVLLQSFHGADSPGGLPEIGAPYCPAVPNSSGVEGQLTVFGSTQIASNDVHLLATDLPLGQFGIFLTSQTPGMIAQPGISQGVLCLDQAIGRFNETQQIFATGEFGTGCLKVDLNQMPTPTTPVAVMAGQTWNFQAWHRDLNPGSTSNFTEAVAVSFP